MDSVESTVEMQQPLNGTQTNTESKVRNRSVDQLINIEAPSPIETREMSIQSKSKLGSVNTDNRGILAAISQESIVEILKTEEKVGEKTVPNRQ